MQVENGSMTKWTGRVPPLDLSGVSVCPRETDHRWHQQTKSTVSNKNMYANGTVNGLSADGLPCGTFSYWRIKKIQKN